MTDSTGRSSLPVTPPGSPGPASGSPGSRPALSYQRIALVDLLDRVLAGGVVIMGEVRLAIADVDLVTISVRALISSVSTVLGDPAGDPAAQGWPPREEQAHDG